MSLNKRKTVLITGGSSGVGYEKAKQMSSKGYEVIICGRSMSRLNEAKRKVPELHIVQCDVSSHEDRKRLVNTVLDQFGKLDILINNAGIAKRYFFYEVNNLEDITEYEWTINYLAPLSLIKMFLPLLEKSKGQIVNVTSGLVYVPLYIEPNYCATKAALHSYTVSLRFHLKDSDVSVSEIFYPEMNTPFQEGHASSKALEPDVAATIAIQGLEQGKEEIRVKRSNLLYTLSRLMPNRILHILNGSIGDRIEQARSKGSLSSGK